MKIQKRVYLDEVHGERRRSSRYRVEAPAELSWIVLDNENRASGWVLELDREWAYITTHSELPVGTEVHVFVILPPFGELNRVLKIGFDATVERADVREGNEQGLAMQISHLVLMGDEESDEFFDDADGSDVPTMGDRRG
jgi:hypothetical protein